MTTTTMGVVIAPSSDLATLAAQEVPAAGKGREALSLREAAIVVLIRLGEPLRAAEIVVQIRELGLRPQGGTRTPAQSINRDLHSAVRSGDTRVAPGPQPGQFYAVLGEQMPRVAAPRSLAPRPLPTRGPRLAIEPLQAAIDASGGMLAAGFHAFGAQTEKTVSRLSRAYHRAVTRGWIDLYTADDICVLFLRTHPCMLWGLGWWDTLAEADRRDGCELEDATTEGS